MRHERYDRHCEARNDCGIINETACCRRHRRRNHVNPAVLRPWSKPEEVFTQSIISRRKKGCALHYQIALCDDDETVLAQLTRLLTRAFERETLSADVSVFTGAEALLAAMRDTPFDALFLDIDMPGMDGIALADTLRRRGDATPIVFLSAREERVFETFRIAPLRFVRKSHVQSDLPEAVRAVAASLRAGSRVRLPLLTPQGMVRVAVDEVMWAESFGKKQTLVMTTGTLEVRHTLHELCEKLAPHGFLQVHRCYVVSCRYIFSIEAGRLIMDDRREIPISRYRLAECKEAFRRSISHGLDAAEHRTEGNI